MFSILMARIPFFNMIQNCISRIIKMILQLLGLGIPTAFVTGVHFPSIDLQKATLVFDVLVTNPSRFPIPLTDMSYSVESHGQKLFSAGITKAEIIRANSSSTIEIPVTMVYLDILRTATNFRPGSVVPFKIKVDFVFRVPVFGKKTVSFDYDGEIPIPRVPIILLEKIEFLKFSFEECEVSLHLKVKNTNEFEMGVTSLECELRLAGITIGSAGMEKSARVEKTAVTLVEIPISFRPKNLGSAVWRLLAGKEASYSINGSIGVDTVFGNIKFPFSEEGSTSLIK